MKTLFAVSCFLLSSAVQAEVPSYLVYCDEDEFQYMNDHWEQEIEIDCIVIREDTIYTDCALRIRGDSLYMSVAEVLGERTVVSRIDEIVFGSIGQDVSYGRTPDGGFLWENQEVPTPGSSNSGPGPYPGTLLVGNPFPNPCRGNDLALDFEIDQSWTTISVYDLAGRLVSVLDDRQMPEGQHRMSWNLEGFSGVPVPNGVHLILVEHAGAIPAAKKVVVLSH